MKKTKKKGNELRLAVLKWLPWKDMFNMPCGYSYHGAFSGLNKCSEDLKKYTAICTKCKGTDKIDMGVVEWGEILMCTKKNQIQISSNGNIFLWNTGEQSATWITKADLTKKPEEQSETVTEKLLELIK
jgi:hypothetical protein